MTSLVNSPQHKHWPTGPAHFSDRRASTLYLSLALQDHRVKCRASRLKITVARSMTNFATFSCILFLKFRYVCIRAGTNTPSDEYDTYRDTGWRIRYVSRIHFFSEAKLGNGPMVPPNGLFRISSYVVFVIIIIIRQPLCPVVGRRPQHAVSKLPCLVLSSAISCRSSICPGRLSIAWLVSLVVFSCHMVSNW